MSAITNIYDFYFSMSSMTLLEDMKEAFVTTVENFSDELEEVFATWKCWQIIVLTIFVVFLWWKFMDFFFWRDEPLLKVNFRFVFWVFLVFFP